jgi:hypothetical protein
MDAYRGMFVSEDEFMRLVGGGGSHEHESEGPEQEALRIELFRHNAPLRSKADFTSPPAVITTFTL